jgi:predicted PurR-regulated permease PerM
VFYLLKDREAAVGGFYSLLPADARRHARNVVAIANDVLGAYIRAQLTLGVIVGAVVFLGLFALGIRFAALLGLIAGVFELIPIIGPLLGAIPGVLVALATSPADVLWVILLYAGVQLVENWVLVPRIQGRAVDIHPAIVMLLLVISSEVAGLWGVVVAVPLAAVARDVFLYFLHEWSEAPPEPPDETPAPVDEGLADAPGGTAPSASA